MLDNLIRNASEALRDAGVVRPRIAVTATTTPDGVCVRVKDNGPGVPAALRAQLFERYVSTKSTGTGLGLALVRDAIERTGGSVRLAEPSAEWAGAHFVLSLPFAEQTNLHPVVKPADTASSERGARKVRALVSGVHRRPAIRGHSVLIVDDDLATRTMVETALELSGAIVTTAEGYEQAMALTGRFDIALVDVHLGDGRGDELLAELRERGVGIAVILTGSSRELAPEAQPDAVLRKPFELQELELLLDALLEPSEAPAEESQG